MSIMLRLRFIVSAAALAAGSSAAQPPAAARAVPYRLVHASATCGTELPSVHRIAGSRRLKHILGAASAEHRPEVDRELVLRISMGQQSSAGATLSLAGVRTAKAGELLVDMQWAPPDPSRPHAMVMTRPCVILSLPDEGYRTVQALDQTGQVRASATLAPRR